MCYNLYINLLVKEVAVLLDRLIVEGDRALKTLFHQPISQREHPDAHITDGEFDETERKHIIGLMRINHTGEVCAQGLYQGQAITARDKTHKDSFAHAADEETEHLAWTKSRIEELGGKTSILNPLFYIGSLGMGVVAGLFGDKWNLGFLEETENQVGNHLAEHLEKIPEHDNKSRAILSQMQVDEAKHAEMAHDAGAAELPLPIKGLMKLSSKVMTKTTYYI